MILKRKLSLGLGFLFLIIFLLIILCSFYVQNLARDSDNILKNNYVSIVYSKNMLLSIDDMKTAITSTVFNPDKKNMEHYFKLFETAKTEFEKNKKSENDNITEIHEKEYVDKLNKNYEIFINLSNRIKHGGINNSIYFTDYISAYEKIKQSIININDINMQAVERKNQLTKDYAYNIIRNMALIGTFLLILALGYFWYFPFYISNTVSYLSDKIVELLKISKIKYDFKSNDETFIILKAIDLLQDKLSGKYKK
jgi:two-component system, NtrC family, sensor histidine kinase KinB